MIINKIVDKVMGELYGGSCRIVQKSQRFHRVSNFRRVAAKDKDSLSNFAD